jgi:alkanesulfonate monooxygenase SsuD/methylene tetrahydromethanopterin reductase-like flavin-dependent oxidoreductase (luciferase family)
MRKLKIGLGLNNVVDPAGAPRYTLHDLVANTVRAEEEDFDAVWVSDAPFAHRTLASWDPVVVLGALAAATSKIELGTGILQPQHGNPAYLARAWSTADYLSGNRTLMGVGFGAGRPGMVARQYAATAALRSGPPTERGSELYSHRVKHYEESLRIIRRLWYEEKVDFDGELFGFDKMTLGHARPEAGRVPPIILSQGIYYPKAPGGPVHHRWSEERAGKFVLGNPRRILELGDGWACAIAGPEDVASGWQRIQDTGREFGVADERVQAMHRLVTVYVHIDDDVERGRRSARQMLNEYHGDNVADDVLDRWVVVGPPSRIAERLLQYGEAGATCFQLCMAGQDLEAIRRTLVEEVVPIVRANDRGVPSIAQA